MDRKRALDELRRINDSPGMSPRSHKTEEKYSRKNAGIRAWSREHGYRAATILFHAVIAPSGGHPKTPSVRICGFEEFVFSRFVFSSVPGPT